MIRVRLRLSFSNNKKDFHITNEEKRKGEKLTKHINKVFRPDSLIN